jgi:GDPmannose 4,6-dehydratase
MDKKIALITGISGQDGSYLAEFLLSKGYEVHGTLRRSSSFNTGRIDHIFDKLHLHYADLLDQTSISSVISKIQPTEVYHLAAMSHVKVSFEVPHYAVNSTAMGTLNILESIRNHCPFAKMYNASSSEMFGSSPAPQNENTPFLPQSPYACGKVCAHYLCRNYRESYGMFVCSGILMNHESERRGETFVTRKITKAVARIKMGLQKELRLGNLDARRDWGYARDYIYAMYLMLQQNHPDDYVIATGKSYSVRDFLEEAFSYVGLNWEDYVIVDPKYYRPSEVNHLEGDCSKAKSILGWIPKTSMKELCHIMVVYDLNEVSKSIM